MPSSAVGRDARGVDDGTAPHLTRRTLLAAGIALGLAGCADADEPPERTGGPEMTDEAPLTLPEPDRRGSVPLEAAMEDRRSVREYGDRGVSLATLGQVLWATQGITAPWGGRTAPSAGARYPLELDVVVGEVDGLPPGIHRYRPDDHEVVRRTNADVRDTLQVACGGQDPVGAAPVCLVVSGVVARTEERYGDRAERYVWLEAGHAAQNAALQATALDLGLVTIGAFDDREVADVLGLGSGEAPLYVLPFGHGDR